MFENFNFENPEFFWLLLLLPIAAAWYVWKSKKQTAELKISSIKGFQIQKSWLPKLRPILYVLRLLTLALIITALARPRTMEVSMKTSSTMGIDIVMAIDVSTSMLARDFSPNRLEALKDVAAEFVRGRHSDRLGIVVFAAESFTKTPVTSDKMMVLNSLEEVSFEMGIEDGTAIGLGLATAVNRLKDSKAKGKVIILLTDGENNAGSIDPLTASVLAMEHDIKVYTIGVGTNGTAMSPVSLPTGHVVYQPTEVKIDEELLQEIAEETGGNYFRATDKEKLEKIYEEIDQLEKVEIEETRYLNFQEKFRPLVMWALFFLMLEIILRWSVFRSFV